MDACAAANYLMCGLAAPNVYTAALASNMTDSMKGFTYLLGISQRDKTLNAQLLAFPLEAPAWHRMDVRVSVGPA